MIRDKDPQMNVLATEKTMTVKEVACALGVSTDLIKKRIREIFPDLMKNGKMTYLTQAQATAIKLRISENPGLATYDDRHRLTGMPKTDLEIELIIQQALNLQQEKIENLRGQLTEMKPKVDFYDQVTNSKDAIDIGSASKVLNIKGMGRNNLFEALRDLKILMPNNQPYQKYIDAGYFRTIEQKYTKLDGSTHINIKTVIYQKGLDYIRRRVTP